MDFEQITKRLEWLDDQERKNKAGVSEITKSLASLETTVNAISKQFKTLSKDVGDLGPVTARLDQLINSCPSSVRNGARPWKASRRRPDSASARH